MVRAFRVFCAALLSTLVVGFGSTPALAQDPAPFAKVPTGLTVAGTGCLAPAAGRVVGSATLLAGVPRFTAGTVRGRMEVREPGGSASLRSWTSDVVPSGEALSWQVDPPLPDGGYEWRMRSEAPDGVVGGWSGWCGFTVDATLDGEPVADVECPAALTDPLEAADESAALLLAGFPARLPAGVRSVGVQYGDRGSL
jgi:hypothetical protein